MNKVELTNLLKNGTVEVLFTKTDGTERVMRCTLRDVPLPENKDASRSRVKSGSVVTVYDVEAKDWRSFRFSSIKRVAVPQNDGSTRLYTLGV